MANMSGLGVSIPHRVQWPGGACKCDDPSRDQGPYLQRTQVIRQKVGEITTITIMDYESVNQ
jgi:hypothetical protein